MELSERCIHTLEKENLSNIYEWQDKPNFVYEEHCHKGRVVFYVTEGSIELKMNGEIHQLRTGDRFEVPPGTSHSAVVGPLGAQYVVGEEIDGDS